MQIPISEFMFQLASGDDAELAVHDGHQIGSRLCVPPFPSDDITWFDEHRRNLAVRFRDGGFPEGIQLEDIKHTEGEYPVAGETGEDLVVTGRFDTLRKAQEEAYERAGSVILPNKFYRSDIGDRWTKEARLLEKWGYLRADDAPAESLGVQIKPYLKEVEL